MKDVRIGTQNLIEEKREDTMREICNGTQGRSSEKKEMFSVTYVCRGDIIYAFEDADIFEEVKARVNRMDDSDMECLASKMADDYCNQMFWESLRIIFEDRFLEQQEVLNGQATD